MSPGSKATAAARLAEVEEICDRLRERVDDFLDDVESTPLGMQLLREYRQTAKMVVELRLKTEDRLDEDIFQEAVLSAIDEVDPALKARIIEAIAELVDEFEGIE